MSPMLCNQRKTIGLFICKLPEYFQRTICGTLANEAKRNGYNLIVFSTFGEYDNNQDYIDGESNLLEIPCYEELDAIVLCLDVFDIPDMADKLIERVKMKANCPVISIRQKQEDFISILSDDKKLIIDMVEHLIDVHQARKIYYLSGDQTMHDINRREKGFRSIVAKRKLPFKEEYIYEGNLWYNIGTEAVEYFLGLEDDLPDAIVCANDYMALAVCDELEKRGYRVPNDIIVTGFDDVEEATSGYHMLSTVSVSPENYATKAMEIILANEQGKTLKNEYYIETKNEYRSTCGCWNVENVGEKFTRLFEKNMRMIHLYKQNMYMVFRMEGIRQIEGVPDLVGRFVEGTRGIKDFYICLNSNEEYDYSEEGQQAFEEEMEMLLHAHYGKNNSIEVPMPRKKFERKTLLPTEEISEDSQIFYVNPMHYRNHCFGYAIIALQDNRFESGEDFYQSFVINISNVLENIYNQNQIEKLSNEKINLIRRDPVTGVLNQYGFYEMATTVLREVLVAEKNCAFLYLKLDNHQDITDMYGRKEGDEALCQLRNILEKFEKEKHVLGRMADSEFCLMIENRTDEDLIFITQQIFELVNNTNIEWDKEYYMDVRIGWYIKGNEKIMSIDECLRHAKVKMNMGIHARKATKYVFEVVKYIRQNYYLDLPVSEMANHIGVTRAYLTHCFKSTYGMTIQEYLVNYRMKKAKEILLESNAKIRDVAFQVGYKDELHFSKVFKKHFGKSPKTFRERG